MISRQDAASLVRRRQAGVALLGEPLSGGTLSAAVSHEERPETCATSWRSSSSPRHDCRHCACFGPSHVVVSTIPPCLRNTWPPNTSQTADVLPTVQHHAPHGVPTADSADFLSGARALRTILRLAGAPSLIFCIRARSGVQCEVDDTAEAATPDTDPATDQRAPCPCLNGGTCLLIPSSGQHVCKCVPRLTCTCLSSATQILGVV